MLSFAQDKIIKTDNTIILSKIVEIGNVTITYKKFSDLYGPSEFIKKDDVVMIIYENGTQQNFNLGKKAEEPGQKPVEVKKNDADTYGNADLIIVGSGDSIRCSIDEVGKAFISYHVRKAGQDYKSSIALDEIVKYFYNMQWNNGNGLAPSVEKARNYVLHQKINNAISTYSLLLPLGKSDAVLLAEYAYALALGGLYDAALFRLDLSWSLEVKSPDVNYFTAKVFELMGYNDLAAEYWKATDKYQAPAWISPESAKLLQRYAYKKPVNFKPDRTKIKADFKRANELDSLNLNFQAIGLFRKIIDIYPNQYLPYIGYSLVLEKTGAYASSAKAIDQAISLIGDKPEDQDLKQFLQKRLQLITQRITTLPTDGMPGLIQTKVSVKPPMQMSAYIGGMLAPSMFSLSSRVGYFIEESTNASFDFGVSRFSGVTSVNLGVSMYGRFKVLVTGVGFTLTVANGKPSAGIKLSVGMSIKNKDKTSSFDIFLDGTTALAKNSYTNVCFSIGKTIYFGRRK